MDDATRKAIENVVGKIDVGSRLSGEAIDEDTALMGAFLQDALAREAERTTLVTPEWLDGAEAKRLGFELDVCEWTTPASDPDGNDLDVVSIGICEEARPCYLRLVASSGEAWYVTVNAVPTIAQVRAAVFLATGRM